jgi:hypothetical protein
MNWSRFLPRASDDYEGPRLAFYFLVLIAIVSSVRSLVHILAPDGGASTIAALAVGVAGGGNIIAVFGQWGASQLILAVFYWLVILRYRFLVPFMLAVVFLEQVLRIGVGFFKPLEVAASPPGEIGSYVLLPASLIALWISLRQTPGGRRAPADDLEG